MSTMCNDAAPLIAAVRQPASGDSGHYFLARLDREGCACGQQQSSDVFASPIFSNGSSSLTHPANPAPAEEAFLTAIAIARQQKAKSFELRAALSLAKLYQSTGRAADVHAVLAPVLQGFPPTPEFPEIQEAKYAACRLAASTFRRSGGFRSWHEASVRDVCSHGGSHCARLCCNTDFHIRAAALSSPATYCVSGGDDSRLNLRIQPALTVRR